MQARRGGGAVPQRRRRGRPDVGADAARRDAHGQHALRRTAAPHLPLLVLRCRRRRHRPPCCWHHAGAGGVPAHGPGVYARPLPDPLAHAGEGTRKYGYIRTVMLRRWLGNLAIPDCLCCHLQLVADRLDSLRRYPIHWHVQVNKRGEGVLMAGSSGKLVISATRPTAARARHRAKADTTLQRACGRCTGHRGCLSPPPASHSTHRRHTPRPLLTCHRTSCHSFPA